MGLEVGLPRAGILMTDQNLEDVYRTLFVQKNDFFQNVRYGITFLQSQQQLRLKSYDDSYRWIDAVSNPNLGVSYVVSVNKVVVPQALLQEPFFHADYPLAVLYGGLGAEMSLAFAQALSPPDILYAGDGTLLISQHPAVNQSELLFLHPMSCLRRWWGKEGFARPDASNQTTFRALIAISGLRIALNALKAELALYPHVHQPALEDYENEQLFFITFAQSVCSMKTDQQRDLDNTLDVTMDDKSLLSVVLSQVKDFASTFSCTSANLFFTEIPCEDVL